MDIISKEDSQEKRDGFWSKKNRQRKLQRARANEERDLGAWEKGGTI